MNVEPCSEGNDHLSSFPPEFLSKPTHLSILQSIVKDHATRIRCVVVNCYKGFLSKSEFHQLYPEETFSNIPSRASFYCLPLSFNQKKDEDCPFQIRYLLKKGHCHCEFTKQSCFTHSHRCGNHLKKIEGSVYVNFEKDLTEKESLIIQHLCQARISVTQMATVLEAQ